MIPSVEFSYKILLSRALHPGQFPMYANPGPLSQLDRERLAGARYYSGIPPPHGLGMDPNDPMVS